jgi:curved DNA-binding protein CbpA
MSLYPYSVFELPEDATDAQVQARYRELVAQHPPDRDPDGFARVRQAHEALKDARQRVHTRLFHFDDTGRAVTEELPAWLRSRPRRRLGVGELGRLMEPGGEDGERNRHG